MPPALELHNTATHRREPFVPADPTAVTFYSCGPTVYDDAHIGNFRAFLVADLLRRWIESPLCALQAPSGAAHPGPRRVLHVMNITDVGHMTEDDNADGGGEDKMALAGRRIAEAKKSGALPEDATIDPRDPAAIADFFAQRFMDDAVRLGLRVAIEARQDPSLMPRASDHVRTMIDAVNALIDRGLAYVRGEPGSRAVYFDVQRLPGYGSLSGNELDALRGGAGGRVSSANQSQKNHPADFLLWKEDPKHLMKWPSPWGPGYPGWHIECTAMSLGRLVPGGLDAVLRRPDPALTIDLHSGGEDNIFPHHECENAQSRGLTGGDRFARCWVHTRFLMVDGQKMSKSRGTFYTPRQLMARGVEPAAIRLELIRTHYRANADFSLQGLEAAAKQVARWRRFAHAASQPQPGQPQPSLPQPIDTTHAHNTRENARQEFAAAMAADLNIAEALGAMNRWMAAVPVPGPADAKLLQDFDAVLGVLELRPAESTQTLIGLFVGVEPDPAVEGLLAQRREARAAKDFARADAIRDRLTSMGLLIKDAPGGRVEVSRAPDAPAR